MSWVDERLSGAVVGNDANVMTESAATCADDNPLNCAAVSRLTLVALICAICTAVKPPRVVDEKVVICVEVSSPMSVLEKPWSCVETSESICAPESAPNWAVVRKPRTVELKPSSWVVVRPAICAVVSA